MGEETKWVVSRESGESGLGRFMGVDEGLGRLTDFLGVWIWIWVWLLLGSLLRDWVMMMSDQFACIINFSAVAPGAHDLTPALPSLPQVSARGEESMIDPDTAQYYTYVTVRHTYSPSQAGATPSFSMSTIYRSQVSIVLR